MTTTPAASAVTSLFIANAMGPLPQNMVFDVFQKMMNHFGRKGSPQRVQHRHNVNDFLREVSGSKCPYCAPTRG
jgi:hypothetical protein